MPPTKAGLALPPWVLGGQIESLLADAGLRHHRAGPAGRDGLYSVSTHERYLRLRRPQLIDCRRVLGPGDEEDFAALVSADAALSNIDPSAIIDSQFLLDRAF